MQRICVCVSYATKVHQQTMRCDQEGLHAAACGRAMPGQWVAS